MNRLRCLAICYLRDKNRVFVGEGYDPHKKQAFYRPLGGGIEWREHSREAVMREFREEMGSELKDLKFETVIENRFTYDGKQGHEIVLVYSAAFRDPGLYKVDKIDCIEGNGQKFNGVWMDLDDFGPDRPLYPDGLLEHLKKP